MAEATTETRGSDSKWELWVASSLGHRGIADLQLTTSGVWIDMPMTEEDKRYGPAVPYYSSTSSIIAKDGSVKPDGSMGAAAVRLPLNAEDKYEVQSTSFTGPISSTSAELRGLTLAQTLIHPDDDTTILTDSLASLHALRRRHRTDFQYYEEQHSIQPHFDQLVHQLNSKAAELMRFTPSPLPRFLDMLVTL